MKVEQSINYPSSCLLAYKPGSENLSIRAGSHLGVNLLTGCGNHRQLNAAAKGLAVVSLLESVGCKKRIMYLILLRGAY